VTHSCNHSQPQSSALLVSHLPDEAATRRLGARIGTCVRPGFRVYLRGELGSGKTTLVRGMLESLGYRGRVKSPTYALVELYVVSRLDLYHFDFYRFQGSKEWDEAGLREYFDNAAACIVEWPEKVGPDLPGPDLEVVLTHVASGREASVRGLSPAGRQCLKEWPAD
jgi:tRNA threonylcarbamoyladenosine biosynthesis protein TsaE